MNGNILDLATRWWIGLGSAATTLLRVTLILIAAWLLIAVLQRAIRTLRERIANHTQEPLPRVFEFEDASGNLMPPGTYKFEAQATYDNETKGLYTLLPANVDSVTLGGSELMLNLAGLGSVPISQVQVIGQ